MYKNCIDYITCTFQTTWIKLEMEVVIEYDYFFENNLHVYIIQTLIKIFLFYVDFYFICFFFSKIIVLWLTIATFVHILQCLNFIESGLEFFFDIIHILFFFPISTINVKTLSWYITCIVYQFSIQFETKDQCNFDSLVRINCSEV